MNCTLSTGLAGDAGEVAVDSEGAVGTSVAVGVSDGGEVRILVGAGVLVDSSVAVGIDPSPHADSIATASKLTSPVHTIRRTDSLNISRNEE